MSDTLSNLLTIEERAAVAKRQREAAEHKQPETQETDSIHQDDEESDINTWETEGGSGIYH